MTRKDARLPPVLACWAVALACLAGCGQSSGSKLGPPDLSGGYDVMWPSGRIAEDGSLVPMHIWHFAMTPNGRFRYRHLDVTVADSEWTQVEGSWQAVPGDDGLWSLVPDLGRESLEPDEFAPGHWPEVEWETFTLMVPGLDPKTGRLGRGVCMTGDPRRPEPAWIRAQAEKALRGVARLPAAPVGRDDGGASR